MVRRVIRSRRCRFLLAAAFGLFAFAAPAGPASAAGLLEFLFGGPRPAPSLPPQPIVTPATQAFAYSPDESNRVDPPRAGGPAHCVRLCDGKPFPIPNTGLPAAQACSAMCPASQTKIFSGGSIDYAVSYDGRRYADLPNAFVYRSRVVQNCTCNGRTPGGLVSIDAKDDPTLRPGDIVATNGGFVAYAGARNKTAEFTPVQSYRGLTAETFAGALDHEQVG
ncbi:MAG: DUF2865 domain-containing protein, partial [Xanthobacteraceae bacterium]